MRTKWSRLPMSKRCSRWFEQLPFKPFEFHGFFGNRHVVSFGWSYDLYRRQLCGGASRSTLPASLARTGGGLRGYCGRQRCSRSSSTNMRPAPASAGTVTVRCIEDVDCYLARHRLHACGLRHKQGTGWERASAVGAATLRLPVARGSHGGNGSIVFRRSNSFATR